MVLKPLPDIPPEDRIKILALARVRGIGLRIFEKLFMEFETIDAIFESKSGDFPEFISYSIKEEIISKKCLEEIGDYTGVLERCGVEFITILDPNYPILLREIADPPLILYYKGDFELSDFDNCMAVVGTRNCSDYGRQITQNIVKKLVESGLCIVSGMAFGIDRLAHESAIDACGRTMAVLSGRVDQPSPYSNVDIYKKILRNGCIISETHLDQDIRPGMFPARNRIISGLSLGALIIEAGKKSGALITAQLALEQGREVFTVPGNIFSEKSVGTNALIKRGEAKLVQDVDDIFEELGYKNSELKTQGARLKLEMQDLSGDERQIAEFLLTKGPSGIDEISKGINQSISDVTQLVSMMELNKKLAKIDGDRYVVVQ